MMFCCLNALIFKTFGFSYAFIYFISILKEYLTHRPFKLLIYVVVEYEIMLSASIEACFLISLEL